MGTCMSEEDKVKEKKMEDGVLKIAESIKRGNVGTDIFKEKFYIFIKEKNTLRTMVIDLKTNELVEEGKYAIKPRPS